LSGLLASNPLDQLTCDAVEALSREHGLQPPQLAISPLCVALCDVSSSHLIAASSQVRGRSLPELVNAPGFRLQRVVEFLRLGTVAGLSRRSNAVAARSGEVNPPSDASFVEGHCW